MAEGFLIKIVFIYGGPGVSPISLAQTKATLNILLNLNYKIKTIFPEQIINDTWEKKAALLVIPGGADIHYMQALNGKGNEKIRAYIEEGGAYLGICAGGYYAGNFVDFSRGTEIEMLGKRELAFFPGTVKGPVLAPYNYNNESGARAALIRWNDSYGFEKNFPFIIYYNGGGYFVDATLSQNTHILACYDKEKQPAIIECQVGKGIAILSGVHFEYSPFLLDSNNKFHAQIIPQLKENEKQRRELMVHLLDRLLSSNKTNKILKSKCDLTPDCAPNLARRLFIKMHLLFCAPHQTRLSLVSLCKYASAIL